MPRYTLALAAAAALSSATLGAQARTHTVRGAVRDTAGQPIDQVQVLALTEGRKTMTGSDGRFQLDTFQLGEERFLFRRLGFNPVEMTVVIREDDEEIDVRMTPVAQELKAIVVRGRRSGVLGVIQDVDDQPVPNALVTVLGGASATTSDSLGRFSLPSVPAGTFMLMVRKRGYFAVKRSVTLPVGAALDISVLLAAVPRNIGGKSIDRLAGFGGILDMAWDAHASRRIRCAGGNAIFVPREQLAEQRALRLDFALPRAPAALNRGFGRAELRTYALYIDGLTAEGWPLSAIRADEVEAVEVYRGVSTRTPLTVVPGSTTPSSQAFAASTVCPNGSIWVWLR